MGIKISNTDIADIKIGGVSALRVMRGGQEVWSGIPDPVVVQSITLDVSGFLATIELSVPGSVGADGLSGLTLHGVWGDSLPTYVSGSGSSLLVAELSRGIELDEKNNVTWSYLPQADGVKNSEGVEMLADAGSVDASETEYYAGNLVSWPSDLVGYKRRFELFVPAAEITKAWSKSSNNARLAVPFTEDDLPLSFWNYVRPDGLDIVIRDAGGTVPFWRQRFDKEARQMTLWVTPSTTAGTDMRLYLYCANPTSGLDGSAAPCMRFAQVVFDDESLTGSGYLDGGSNLPLSVLGDEVTPLEASPVPHRIAAGVKTSGSQRLFMDPDGGAMVIGGVRPHYVGLRIRLPETPPPLEVWVGLAHSSNNFRGVLKDLELRSNAGVLELGMHFGEGRRIFWPIPAEKLGQEVWLKIGIDADMAGGSFATTTTSVLSGMPVWLDGERLTGGYTSGSTSLITFTAEFGPRFTIGGGGYNSSTKSFVGLNGAARGAPDISVIQYHRGSAATYDDARALMEYRMIERKSEFMETQLQMNVNDVEGVLLSFEAEAGHRYHMEIFASDGIEKIGVPFSGIEPSVPGMVQRAWNKRDALGNLMPPGDYIFRLVDVPMKPTWQGVIGTSSFDPERINGINDTPVLRSFFHPQDCAVTDTGKIHLAPGYNEQQPRLYRFDAADFTKPAISTHDNLRHNCFGVCTDGAHVFVLANFDELGSLACDNRILKFVHQESMAGNLSLLAETSIGGEPVYTYNDQGQIADATAKFDSGIACLKNSDVVAVSSQNRPGEGIRLFDKSIAFTGALDVGAAFRIARLADDSGFIFPALDAASGTWRIGTVTNIGSTNDVAWIVSGLAERPLDLDVDPVTGQFAIYVGGGQAQVQGYDLSGALLWTLGQAGGYRDNGPVVAPDKYDPISYRRNDVGHGVVSFDHLGRCYVYDAGCKRWLIHAPAGAGLPREVLQEVHLGIANYFLEVDPGEPTRVFSENLEYALAYGTSDTAAWTLQRNWRYHPMLEQSSNGNFAIVRTVEVAAETKTFALVAWDAVTWSQGYRVLMLPASGQAVDTGKNLSRHYTVSSDGSLVWIDISFADHERRMVKALTGWDANGYPQWEAAWTETHRWPIEAYPALTTTPRVGIHGQTFDLGVSGPCGYRHDAFDDGSFPVYWNGRNPFHGSGAGKTIQYHYGIVPAGGVDFQTLGMHGGTYKQRFEGQGWPFNHPLWGVIYNPDEKWGVFPDAIDTANGSYGNRCYANGPYALLGQHGELQLQGQASQMYLYDKDGSFIEQFCRNNVSIKNSVWPASEATGNNFSIHLIQATNGEWYVLHNDEGVWSAPHVWWLRDLTLVAKTDTPISLA